MVKMVPVPGAEKNSYGRQKPVMTCDGKGCDAKVEGNGGQDESTLKERAFSLGFQQDPKTSKHHCPDCVIANAKSVQDDNVDKGGKNAGDGKK